MSKPLPPLPSVGDLSEQQIRGTACVHCGIILDNATAVDLGAQPLRRADSVTSWFPRACRLPHP